MPAVVICGILAAVILLVRYDWLMYWKFREVPGIVLVLLFGDRAARRRLRYVLKGRRHADRGLAALNARGLRAARDLLQLYLRVAKRLDFALEHGLLVRPPRAPWPAAGQPAVPRPARPATSSSADCNCGSCHKARLRGLLTTGLLTADEARERLADPWQASLDRQAAEVARVMQVPLSAIGIMPEPDGSGWAVTLFVEERPGLYRRWEAP